MSGIRTILVVNAGSSSVKFRVFLVEGEQALRQIVKGDVDGIGVRPRLSATGADDEKLVDQSCSATDIPDVTTAMRTAGQWLRETQRLSFDAIGHRVVHGGPRYDRPTLVNRTILSDLERFIPLAPLHQPNNLAPIRVLIERFPDMPQVACFDTAFHRGHDKVTDCYAIPGSLYDEGVRRYGFHGLSYEYVVNRLHDIMPAAADGRIVIAHLGSGASMCAVSQGRSVESTMGFTALDGLPMGTRPGQLDPGVVLYLLTEKGMDAATAQDFLYKNCGLKGLSGISNDVRKLLDSSEPGASLALEHFVYRVGLYAGMLAASLGGLDTFVFTAGIGERSAILRERITKRLAWLGARLDAGANGAGDLSISAQESRVRLLVVPTNEELMIARHTLAAVSTGTAQPHRAAAAS